jgi:hypothetical protein
MGVSRRQFLGTAAIGVVAAKGADAMPKRTLGRTGASVSILAFGSGSRFLMYKEEDAALAALNHALDLGITYVDTAYAYGDGLSEERVGKVMKTRRKEVWLATKVPDRKGDEAMRRIEGSLKRLQTDRVDLIHIHSLGGADDLAAVEAKDGVLATLYKLRDQKVTRAIGITSHTDPSVLKTALERNDFDCTQMALNAARAGMAHLEQDPHGSFETLALPVANRKNMGVIAMKVFAQEKLSGKAPIEKLIQYSLSLPVTAAVIGMPKVEFIEHNIATAKSFQPMPRSEMQQLSNDLAGAYKAAVERHFDGHQDV